MPLDEPAKSAPGPVERTCKPTREIGGRVEGRGEGKGKGQRAVGRRSRWGVIRRAFPPTARDPSAEFGGHPVASSSATGIRDFD